MIVELRGLEVYGYHGVHDAERSAGQSFWFDVELEVGERGADDRLASAVDYTEVAAVIREVSDRQRFALLEALARAVGDELERRFAPARLSLKVRKRPADLPVEWSAVTVSRP